MKASLRELWSITLRWTALELGEGLRRALCRAIGHRWHHETDGEPVTSFFICRRCGKFTR